MLKVPLMADDTAHGGRRLPSIASLIHKNLQPSRYGQPASINTLKTASFDPELGSQSSLADVARLSSSSQLASPMGLRRLSAHSRGVIHQRAADKFQQLSTSFKSRRKLLVEEQLDLPGWIVHPHDIWAQCWWGFILCTVIVTLFVEPYCLAFAAYPGLHPLTSPDTVLSIIIMCVYASDVMLNFVVAYYEDGMLVTEWRRIAAHYARWRLWVDLVTTIPFDWIVLSAMGLQESNSTLAWYISLLRLLRLGRAYRLYHWVTFLTYNQKLSLLAFTLIRNFLVCFFTVHGAACGFYYIAKQSGFADTSWVGAASDWVGSANAFERYIYSMYWSIITFATVGYGDFHAYSVPEAAFTIIYVFINIGVAAYIIGTITLLVVKGDEKTGLYRDRLNVLDAYSSTHEIPHTLKSAMKGHLRLHFSSAETSDEAVLAVYPTTIRRRILRHLYITVLSSKACWLFEGCKQKLLDAVLAAAKVELYMPKVEIISEGDHVNELYIIVAGDAVAESGNSLATSGHPEGLMLEDDGTTSVHGGSTRCLGPGDPAGEMAFFTETPCMESVRTLGVCRVLVIPRIIYATLANDFPVSNRIILDNLVARAEQMVEYELPNPASVFDDLDSMAGLELKFASTEAGADHSNKQSCGPKPGLMVDSKGMPLRHNQQQVLANLLRVRGLANHTRARVEQQQTYEFLNACSSGNLERMRVMLQRGCDVDCADYDGRTGLMLAAGSGSTLAVKLLLMAGAKINLTDRFGNSALLEAAKAGHEQIIELLRLKGALLLTSGVSMAALLCTAVFDGDMRLLLALIKAGANLNASDYDKRTSLHIACADGSLPMVRTLVQHGADPSLTDRWGNTPLDEALRMGASTVVEMLMETVPEATTSEALAKLKLHQATAMLDAAAHGRLAAVQSLLRRGCPADVCDYDHRTGLMLAAANGHEDIVATLLKAGADPNIRDNFGGTAVLEVVKAGHSKVLSMLTAAGASLQPRDEQLANTICTLVQQENLVSLQLFKQAGVDFNTCDYDQRTPLHIAAAEGKLDMVRFLVNDGNANIHLKDRWGATPIDEARRVGAEHIVIFLTEVMVGGAKM